MLYTDDPDSQNAWAFTNAPVFMYGSPLRGVDAAGNDYHAFVERLHLLSLFSIDLGGRLYFNISESLSVGVKPDMEMDLAGLLQGFTLSAYYRLR